MWLHLPPLQSGKYSWAETLGNYGAYLMCFLSFRNQSSALSFDRDLKILFYVFRSVLQSFTMGRVVWYELLYYVWNQKFSHRECDSVTWLFQRHFQMQHVWSSYASQKLRRQELRRYLRHLLPPLLLRPATHRGHWISYIYTSFHPHSSPIGPRCHVEMASQPTHVTLASSPSLCSWQRHRSCVNAHRVISPSPRLLVKVL